MFQFTKLYPLRSKCIAFGMIQRFKGHSKWQNIRHIKAEKDLDKAIMTMVMLRNMRRAVIVNGGVTDPNKNFELQSLMNAAFKANVTRETVSNYLSKMETTKEIVTEYQLRGPKDCIIFISYSGPPAYLTHIRENVKKILRSQTILSKTKGFEHVFEEKGIILAKHPTKSTMDDAEEAGILAEAEEVSCDEDDPTLFKFDTEAATIWKVVKALREDGWDILQSSVEQLPTKFVSLNESEMKDVELILSKLQELPEFLRIAHNIE